MAPEKCFHDCGISWPVPSTSICLMPRCDPRRRRRSLTTPALPVSSQVRQDSTTPGGSTPSVRAVDSSPALSGGVSGAIQRLDIALIPFAETTPLTAPVPVGTARRGSVRGGLDRSLDLEDGRFPDRDRDDLVEHAHGLAVQRMLRQPHIRRRAVREDHGWRAEHTIPGSARSARKRARSSPDRRATLSTTAGSSRFSRSRWRARRSSM